jgi:hypothetical protein
MCIEQYAYGSQGERCVNTPTPEEEAAVTAMHMHTLLEEEA